MTVNDDKNRRAGRAFLLLFLLYIGAYLLCRGTGRIKSFPAGRNVLPTADVTVNSAGRIYTAGRGTLKIFTPLIWAESRCNPRQKYSDNEIH